MPPGPLRSRNFRLLLACDVISASGTAVATVALPFAVLRIGGSPSDVGYVAAAYLVPLIGFLLLGGVVADRLPRHQVMVAVNALQALTQAASAVLLLAGHARVWELAVLAAARGIGTGFYLPASEGLLPHTVPADQRAPANALDRIGRNSGQIGRRFRVLPGPGRAPGRPRDRGHRIAAGASVEVFSVNWATTMQQEIPPAMLSRLSSYDALRSFALAPVGTAVAGPLAGSCSRGETATLT
jgi:hypothetical protein